MLKMSICQLIAFCYQFDTKIHLLGLISAVPSIHLYRGLPPNQSALMEEPGSEDRYLPGGTGALTQDRRISHRFALQLPITLVLPDTGLKVRGKTRDISSGGVFFYANVPIVEYQEIELLMTLPYEFAVSPIRVACRARVLRVERDELNGEKGMAAAIQRFDFLQAGHPADQTIEELVDPALD
jgi:PilZ domain